MSAYCLAFPAELAEFSRYFSARPRPADPPLYDAIRRGLPLQAARIRGEAAPIGVEGTSGPLAFSEKGTPLVRKRRYTGLKGPFDATRAELPAGANKPHPERLKAIGGFTASPTHRLVKRSIALSGRYSRLAASSPFRPSLHIYYAGAGC